MNVYKCLPYLPRVVHFQSYTCLKSINEQRTHVTLWHGRPRHGSVIVWNLFTSRLTDKKTDLLRKLYRIARISDKTPDIITTFTTQTQGETRHKLKILYMVDGDEVHRRHWSYETPVGRAGRKSWTQPLSNEADWGLRWKLPALFHQLQLTTRPTYSSSRVLCSVDSRVLTWEMRISISCSRKGSSLILN